MFIATKAQRDLAPVGAKPGSRASPLGRNGCAPPELRSKEKGNQAINISPRWGEVKNYLRKPSRRKRHGQNRKHS